MNDEHETDPDLDPAQDARIRALLAELGSGPDGEPLEVSAYPERRAGLAAGCRGIVPAMGFLIVFLGAGLGGMARHGVGLAALRFGTAWFRVGGVIADEPDRLSEGFTLGPVVLVSNGGLARTGLVQPGSLFETKYRVAAPGRDPAAAARAFERRFATAGWETRTRDRASPGASRFVARMGEFLGLVGLAALVIAGIGRTLEQRFAL